MAEEIAEGGADGEAAAGEHRRNLAQIVTANALQVALLTDRYPFVERAVGGVEPPLDQDAAHRRLARLALHELVELAVDVQVIEEKHRAGRQNARHLAHDLLILVFVAEVSKTGKEVDDTGEGRR